MESRQIRQAFLDFFKEKEHVIVPSAPMVVKNDPTLMFTNAGMNQFKDIFLGNAAPFALRAADSQKCLRVSGKHNDLEEVGHDTYHHTMFEMLGNWSFGDYFKKEAIEWGWELLTKVFKIDPGRLYATVFEGYAPDGLGLDEEARENWLRFLPEDRVLLGNKKDNFWEMGETGPCGPCSEIHIDLRDDDERAKVPGRELVNKSDPLVIEIWNLVFMQYNRKADGSLEKLPHNNVDTGMGFERLCMALQGKKSNYDTDVFTPLISKVGEIAGKDYATADEKVRIAMRVISDHVRAITFSIADGQLPSNVKAGYVIRRILRRAVRYAYTFLGVKEPLLHKLVPTLVEQMGDFYPEIRKQEGLISKVIKEEEETFLRTLDRGIRLMDDVVAKCKAENRKLVNGTDAFVLYDTFGFPIDLTELIAKENGLEIDHPGFEAELQKQKERSRNAEAKKEGDWIPVGDAESESVFTGYDNTVETGVKILRYREVKTKGKDLFHIVLSKTPFYAESGGQVGDKGWLCSAEGEKIQIINTVKENGLSIHVTDKMPADVSGQFTAQVDEDLRLATTANHSATHLLDYALRKVLGTHIEQKGSYVSPQSLRFDFSHFEKVQSDKLREVERLVNALIRKDIKKEEMRDMPIDEAKKLGAIALFGEKYGDKVRVIKFADSVEFCGGTHIPSTGMIGYFKILSESAIAAGVRRIEATTGKNAEDLVYIEDDMIQNLKELFKNSPNVMDSAKRLMAENENFRKQAEEIMKERAASIKEKAKEIVQNINGIDFIAVKGEFPMELVKTVAFMLRAECRSTVFAAGITDSAKPGLVLMYTDDLVEKGMNAGKDIRPAAKFINGGGGGQPFFASAGGKNLDGIDAALDCIKETISK
ncbi:MAG: alanine--tRNA ligase [Bacteroidales bacterium]|nr:alanine--tRNA ligase [Bacteroidales bacterium]